MTLAEELRSWASRDRNAADEQRAKAAYLRSCNCMHVAEECERLARVHDTIADKYLFDAVKEERREQRQRGRAA